MLFNSYVFIFAFLPMALLGFYLIGRTSHALAALWLVAASLVFYGWWDVRYVGLLLGSIAFNYGAGYAIGQTRGLKNGAQKLLLSACVVVNLSFLAYFKYANFFVDNLNQLTGTGITLATVILPLGISFFTFTQIAFLVDTHQGKVKELNFIHYALFVTYFPHLIAGPVLHHAEMMPQFARRSVCQFHWENVALGLSIFVLGLAKKVLLADSVSDFSTPVFDAVKEGAQPMLIESWVGALAYTLQLYFDFSAYSDMAIGLSLLFNVRLPLNFNSPYKATSIIEFWRRWHMTLSRFLRDYLYIPLGGSRFGTARRYVNLVITMLLGGLWHGAGWTFVIWGALHGLYLLINHAWRGIKNRMGWGDGGRFAAMGAGSLTFLAVVVGWVFFRADSYSSALMMIQGMFGMNGVSLPTTLADRIGHYFAGLSWIQFDGNFPLTGFSNFQAASSIVFGLLFVWLAPNIHQIFERYRPVCEDPEGVNHEKSYSSYLPIASWLNHHLKWQPSRYLAWTLSLLFAYSVMSLTKISEFLYFQF